MCLQPRLSSDLGGFLGCGCLARLPRGMRFGITCQLQFALGPCRSSLGSCPFAAFALSQSGDTGHQAFGMFLRGLCCICLDPRFVFQLLPGFALFFGALCRRCGADRFGCSPLFGRDAGLLLGELALARGLLGLVFGNDLRRRFSPCRGFQRCTAFGFLTQ